MIVGIVSVLVVVLALPGVMLDTSTLLIVLLLFALGGLGFLAFILWQRAQRARDLSSSPSLSREDELKSLGIVDIRPRERSPDPAPQDPAAQSLAEPRPGAPPASADVRAPQERPLPDTGLAPPAPEVAWTPPKEEAAPPARPAERAAPVPASAPAPADDAQGGVAMLASYLQSLQAATGAHTACLLKQEDIALEYDIQALVSVEPNVQRSGTFASKTPLLTPSMMQRPVSVRHVGEGGLPYASLAYYLEPVLIQQVAVAAVPRTSQHETYFLLVDTPQEGLFNAQRQRTLIAQFAQFLATLLDTPDASEETGASSTTPRPRREIIAEEMERARAEERPLALAIVFLNRAEEVADQGISAVATAEQALEAYLRRASNGHRIERFGELTYGVFYAGSIVEVEAWATQVQQGLASETGPLEGGVSIGVAVMQDRHESPDDLRSDATEALREAFESGTCTIME